MRRGILPWFVRRRLYRRERCGALAFFGTALGIVGSIGVTRLLASLLYATSPTDALTLAAVSAFFLAVAAMACFLPTRQVTAIDPVIALRQE